MKTTLVSLIACLVGVGLGVLIGRQLAPSGLASSRQHPDPQTVVDKGGGKSSEPAGAGSETRSRYGASRRARVAVDQLGAAIHRALRIASPIHRQAEFYRLADSIAPTDIPAALAALAKEPDQSVWYGLGRLLLLRWAEADAGAALKYAQALPPSAVRKSALDLVVGEWTRRDWRSASEWVKRLPAGVEKTAFVGTVVSALAEKDGPQAMTLLDSLAPDSLEAKLDLKRKVLAKWAFTDPAAAAKAAAELPTKDFRTLTVIANYWAGLDPEAAVAWVKGLPEGERDAGMMYTLCSALARQGELELAANVALSLPVGEARLNSIAGVTRVIADGDINTAVAWLRQLPDADARARAYAALAGQWADIDPKAAIEFAATLPPGSGRDFQIQDSVRRWASSDPNAAATWASALQDQKERNSAMVKVAEGWAQRAPEEAAAFVARLPAGDVQNRALDAVLRTWTELDPQNTAAWVSTFPKGDTRQRALQEVVTAWARRDAGGTEAWLGTLPAGHERDRAVAAYVGTMANADPVTAARWAQAIADPATGQQQMEKVATAWLSQNEAAAREWILGSSLNEQVKTRLLEHKH